MHPDPIPAPVTDPFTTWEADLASVLAVIRTAPARLRELARTIRYG